MNAQLEIPLRAADVNDALSSNYMLADLTIRSWNGNATDKTASAEVIANKNATADSGKFVKKLLAGADAELKDVQKYASVLHKYVVDNTLPWSSASAGRKNGARLVASARAVAFMDGFNTRKQDYTNAVKRLENVWDTRVQEALRNLGGLADVAAYPQAWEIPLLFDATLDLNPVPDMRDFSRVNIPASLATALADRHKECAEIQIKNAMDDMRARICVELRRIETQLGKHGRGENTRLFDTLVSNMEQLVRLARSMNFSSNPELTALIDAIDHKLLIRPVSVYRDNPGLAAQVAVEAAGILSHADVDSVWEHV